MEKRSPHLVLLISIFAVGLIFSCSKEDTSNRTHENFSSHVEAMRLYYDSDIRTSSSFLSYHSQTQLFVGQLKHLVADLRSRSDFQTWITNNLASTDFPSVNYAMDKFDGMITAEGLVDDTFPEFYKDLDELPNTSDVLYILHEDLAARPHGGVTNPCQDGCIGTVSGNLDFADNLYAIQQASSNKYVRGSAYAVYFDLIENAVANFNDCMNAC